MQELLLLLEVQQDSVLDQLQLLQLQQLRLVQAFLLVELLLLLLLGDLGIRYDLEANLALLKLYLFNPTYNNLTVVVQILLKSLTNLPHTDFVLCKCLLSQEVLEEPQVTRSLSN